LSSGHTEDAAFDARRPTHDSAAIGTKTPAAHSR